MAAFSEDFLSEDDFGAVLATFCCYDYEKNDYGVKASEPVENIATDKKDYHKCSLCVLICWIVKVIIFNISKKGWFTRTPPM